MPPRIKTMVGEALDTVGLGHLAPVGDRLSAASSNAWRWRGQIVRRPRLLMLDEAAQQTSTRCCARKCGWS